MPREISIPIFVSKIPTKLQGIPSTKRAVLNKKETGDKVAGICWGEVEKMVSQVHSPERKVLHLLWKSTIISQIWDLFSLVMFYGL